MNQVEKVLELISIRKRMITLGAPPYMTHEELDEIANTIRMLKADVESQKYELEDLKKLKNLVREHLSLTDNPEWWKGGFAVIRRVDTISSEIKELIKQP